MENKEKILIEHSNETENDTVPEENDFSDTNAILAAILSGVEGIRDLFERKIDRDEHKNKMFDNMHNELVGFRNGVYEKPVNNLALDVIQIIDHIKKDSAFYSDGEITEERYKKLLKCVCGIAQELEDALYRHEIEPYNVSGDAVDTKHQKIISVVETLDPELTGKIAERLADGYEKNGKVLRPERIKAYKYVSLDTKKSENG